MCASHTKHTMEESLGPICLKSRSWRASNAWTHQVPTDFLGNGWRERLAVVLRYRPLMKSFHYNLLVCSLDAWIFCVLTSTRFFLPQFVPVKKFYMRYSPAWAQASNREVVWSCGACRSLLDSRICSVFFYYFVGSPHLLWLQAADFGWCLFNQGLGFGVKYFNQWTHICFEHSFFKLNIRQRDAPVQGLLMKHRQFLKQAKPFYVPTSCWQPFTSGVGFLKTSSKSGAVFR